MPARLTREEFVSAFGPLGVDVDARIAGPVDAGLRIGIVAAHHGCVVWRADDGHPDGDYAIRFTGYTTVPGVVIAAVS